MERLHLKKIKESEAGNPDEDVWEEIKTVGEQIDIQEAHDDLKKTYSEQDKLKKLVEADLKELNIKL